MWFMMLGFGIWVLGVGLGVWVLCRGTSPTAKRLPLGPYQQG